MQAKGKQFNRNKTKKCRDTGLNFTSVCVKFYYVDKSFLTGRNKIPHNGKHHDI